MLFLLETRNCLAGLILTGGKNGTMQTGLIISFFPPLELHTRPQPPPAAFYFQRLKGSYIKLLGLGV